MSTASQIARARAATGARANDRATRLAAAEAAAATAAEMAKQATAAAQAAVAAAAALRAEMEQEPKPVGGSHSPVGCRHQSGVVVGAAALQ